MTTLYLIRHGETKWNLEGRIQGQKDSDLTPLGEKQGKWLGRKLEDTHIDIIISSSSNRALRTAQLIRGTRDITIIPNDNLREMYIGEWEGMLHTDIEEREPNEQYNFWNLPHLYEPCGGESFSDVFNRVSTEVERIIERYKGKKILIVTHAIVLKSLIAYFEKKELKDLWTGVFMKSTCLNIVEIEEKSRKFLLQGDISHYEIE